jgi:hypothetical protein
MKCKAEKIVVVDLNIITAFWGMIIPDQVKHAYQTVMDLVIKQISN